MLFWSWFLKIRHQLLWFFVLAGILSAFLLLSLRMDSFRMAKRHPGVSLNASGSNGFITPGANLNMVFSLRDTATIVIPLKRAGRLYTIEAVIDGESGNLIFDTGATGLVLNKTYFRDYVVSGHQSSRGITGAVNNVERITVNTLRIQELTFHHAGAALANLGHIENRRNIKVLGLFGFGLISDYEVILDFIHNELRLIPVDKKGNRLNVNLPAFQADGSHSIRFLNNVAFLEASVGGKSLNFCFDTGAETNAIGSDAPKTVMNTITITRSLNLKGAGSLSQQVLVGLMNEFSLDNKKFSPMETVITYLDHLNEIYGCHIDGVLGYNFISKCTFCINFEKKRMDICIVKP